MGWKVTLLLASKRTQEEVISPLHYSVYGYGCHLSLQTEPSSGHYRPILDVQMFHT
jgi:hypothetical protein